MNNFDGSLQKIDMKNISQGFELNNYQKTLRGNQRSKSERDKRNGDEVLMSPVNYFREESIDSFKKIEMEGNIVKIQPKKEEDNSENDSLGFEQMRPFE